MVITFTVREQKISHNMTQTLVAESVGIIYADFQFDTSWDDLEKIVVFYSSDKSVKPVPLKWNGEMLPIPTEVLIAGKLYVSAVGFGSGGRRKNTQAWDVMQAISVQRCGALGGCEFLRPMAENDEQQLDPSKLDVATDKEVKDMLDDVFGPKSERSATV